MSVSGSGIYDMKIIDGLDLLVMKGYDRELERREKRRSRTAPRWKNHLYVYQNHKVSRQD